MPGPEFDYLRPPSLSDALALLQEYGERAKILAGGQTLIPALSMGLARPEVLIDIGGIAALRHIDADGDDLVVGALTRHRELEQSATVKERCPLLAAAAALIGHSHVRNRGTIGGSIAHADPAAEYPVALLALEAAVELAGPTGTQTVPADQFFLGPLTTAARPDQLVTAVRIPALDPSLGWDFRELVMRSGDFALVCVGVLLGLDGQRVARAAIAVGGVGPTATRLPDTEAALVGQSAGSGTWHVAGEAAAREIAATGDVSATADYRRATTAVYVEEALHAAASRVR